MMSNLLSLKLHRQSQHLDNSAQIKTKIRTDLLNPIFTARILSDNDETNKDEMDEKLASTGNMFKKRENWSIIKRLPSRKQNSMNIRLGELKF